MLPPLLLSVSASVYYLSLSVAAAPKIGALSANGGTEAQWTAAAPLVTKCRDDYMHTPPHHLPAVALTGASAPELELEQTIEMQQTCKRQKRERGLLY